MIAVAALLLAIQLGLGLQVSAQVYVGGVQSQIAGPWNGPVGVASDTSGNIYVAQFSAGSIVKIDATTHATSTYLTSASGTPLNATQLIWIDSSDNLYVADSDNDRIVMWSITSDSLVATYPAPDVFVVTTDSSGNIWWGSGDNASEIPAGSPSGTVSTAVITSGISDLAGMAFDSEGNLYISDLNANNVYEYTKASSYTTQSTVISGANGPYGLYFDSSDNLYVAEGTLNSVIKYLAPDYTASVQLSPGIANAEGIGADPSGNLFLTAFSGNTVTEVSQGGSGFGQVNVGTSSSVLGVNFEVVAGTTINSIQVLDQGATGQEFNEQNPDTNYNLCTTGTYATNTACSINVIFAPKYPGERSGAVQISTSAGAVATAPISGTGLGPMVGFSPAAQSAITSGLNQPFGIAFDGNGNLFEADYGTGRVKEFLAAGGYSTVRNIYTVSEVGGMAVDGAGNIFFSSYNHGPVMEALAAGGYSTVNTVSTDFNRPFGIAVDGSGNLFVADRTDNAVMEIPYTGGSYGAPVSLGGGFNNPFSVALDTSGNLYVADAGNSAVKEILKTGGYTTVETLASVSGIQSVAVDPNGNVYMAVRGTSNTVSEILAVNGSIPASPTITTLATDPGGPEVVALDSSGNVYYGTSTGANITELNYANAPSLTFASTAVGSISSDSPQTLTIINNGNATLTFPIPSSGNNPSIATNFTLDSSSGGSCPLTYSSSSASATLAAGASCTLPVTFAPTVPGSLSGSLVLTDTNLNASPSTAQTIGLSGTSLQAPVVTATSPSLGPLAGGTSVTMTGTGFTGASAVMFGSVPAGVFTVLSDTSITATAPAGIAGVVDIVVVTAAGTSATVTADWYTYDSVAAQQSVSSAVLTKNHAVTAFTPVTGTGGTAPLAYSISPALPAGLSFSFSTGAITGTASAASTAATYAVTVTDAIGATATASFSLTVNSAVTATQSTASTALIFGQAVGVFTPVTGAGGTGALTYSISPELPAGLSFAPSTGVVSGTAASVSAAVPYMATVTDGNGATATASFSLTVNKAASTLSGPTKQPVQVVSGAASSIAITVTGHYSEPGIATPGSTVSYTVSNNGFAPGTAEISNGLATISVPDTVTPGIYTVTVSYGGDANYDAATSIQVGLQVGQIQPRVSWVQAAAITYGSSLVGALNATATYGANLVPGTYSYLNGSTAVSASTVLPAGSYTLTVNFTPNDTTTYKAATGTVGLTVDKAGVSGVALTSTVNPVLVGNPIRLVATVSSSVSSPTGSVSFFDGSSSTPLGTAMVSGGIAQLPVSMLSVGTHSITAVYSGDTNFMGASSTVLSEQVQDFNLTISNSGASSTDSGSSSGPSSATVIPGGTANYALTLMPTGMSIFPSPVTLSVSGLPTGATFMLNPNSIAAGAGPTNVSLTVSVPSHTVALQHGEPFCRGLVAVLGMLMVPFSRRMRRSASRLGLMARVLLMLTIGLAGVAGLTGCGTSNGFFAHQQQTYDINVVASSGTLTHSATVTLIVE
jgi:sugar lactone lactonase YvrE